MTRYAIRRLLASLMVLLTVSAISFTLLRVSGDLAVALAGADATPAEIERVRIKYGPDRSLAWQYLDWAGRALTGDLGVSIWSQEPVVQLIASKLPVTLALAVLSMALALSLAIPLGVVASLRSNSWLDRACVGTAVAGQAIPNFWFGLLLIVVFGVYLRVLPVSGSETWRHFVLPAVTLGLSAQPTTTRLTRAGMLDVLGADYIRTARAKGLRVHVVLFKHGLRNALIPVVSVAAVQLGLLIGGSLVVETVFAVNGLGLLAWESIIHNDYPVVQTIVLIVSSFYVLLTWGADLLNAVIDPRLRTVDRARRHAVATLARGRYGEVALPIAGWRLRRAVGHQGLLLGAALVMLIALSAVLAPVLAPHDPYAQDLSKRYAKPVWHERGSWTHVFGTDKFGRDVLSRMIYGARVSLVVAIVVAVVSGAIGATLGILAGYFGGRLGPHHSSR